MSGPYLGEIRMFAGSFEPAGWMFCHGQLLAVSQNEALFTLLGATYGGDGRTTFALPDLRGRIPVHTGWGPGGSEFRLGQKGGAETVTLSKNQMPAHAHTPRASSAAAVSPDPAGLVWAASAQANPYASAGTTDMAADALAPAGGGQPHGNMPPYLAINFIIACAGVYPSEH